MKNDIGKDVRDRPFNLKGGLWFRSDFGGGKKKI
jgi:hypothetical protein